VPKLLEIGTISSGFHLRGPANAEAGGAQSVIQLRDVRGGAVDFSGVIRMNLERARPKDYLGPGDILLRSRGASYEAAVVNLCPAETVAAIPLYVLRLKVPRMNPEFLVWYINRPDVQAKLAAQAYGTHIPTVSLEAFAELDVVLPALDEQQRILHLEKLFQQEKDLTARYLEQRGHLIHAAQNIILQHTILKGDPIT
jgi:restriction endonuclease S subunit